MKQRLFSIFDLFKEANPVQCQAPAGGTDAVSPADGQGGGMFVAAAQRKEQR